MNTASYPMRAKTAPSHSFHPNASLLTMRKGYVAGIDNRE